MIDLFERLLILRTPGIGPAKYGALVKKFGGVAAAADALHADATHIDMVRREMEHAARLDIHYICDTDEFYPAALRRVKNHPPVICARGNLAALTRPIVSIVGTRHATAAGLRFIADLAAGFASHGVTVASGMAIGTDTAAHRGALRDGDAAATIAVLAGGADYIWPLENESLYHEIIARGAVISEMPVGFVPIATNFVQRNRIVAGVCDKLVLGEADMKSGSMTTARFAIEYGREIWAVPSHPSDPRAAGPNSLIATGAARLCGGVSDFFADSNKKQDAVKNDTPENILLDKIGTIPLSESVLADIVKKSVSEIKRDLVILELQGLIQKTDGGYVRM